jgi:hypothetical protein
MFGGNTGAQRQKAVNPRPAAEDEPDPKRLRKEDDGSQDWLMDVNMNDEEEDELQMELQGHGLAAPSANLGESYSDLASYWDYTENSIVPTSFKMKPGENNIMIGLNPTPKEEPYYHVHVKSWHQKVKAQFIVDQIKTVPPKTLIYKEQTEKIVDLLHLIFTLFDRNEDALGPIVVKPLMQADMLFENTPLPPKRWFFIGFKFENDELFNLGYTFGALVSHYNRRKKLYDLTKKKMDEAMKKSLKDQEEFRGGTLIRNPLNDDFIDYEDFDTEKINYDHLYEINLKKDIRTLHIYFPNQ